MAHYPPEFRALGSAQSRSVREAVAASFRDRVSGALKSAVPHVLKGSAAASIDFGVYVGEDELNESNGTDANLTLIKKYQHDSAILPISVKVVHPYITGSDETGLSLVQYVINRNASQNVSAAYVIGTTSSPDLVAFIPASYIDAQGLAQDHSIFSEAAVLGPNRPPPFAMEYSAFVLPLNRLGDAVNSMTQYYKDNNVKWSNPHNGIKFHNASPPRACTTNVLLPAANHNTYEEDKNDELEEAEKAIVARVRASQTG